nr:uncharacterized protein LOC111121634 isoform X2 [Crassostrea virginica]
MKRAYRILLLNLHPDKNKHDPRAHEKATLINEAYNTLKHKNSRDLYDRNNPSAGKGTKPYDWGKPIHQKKHSHGVFHHYYSYFGNNIVEAIHVVFQVYDIGQSENDVNWGYFLVFISLYAHRIPIMMFLVLWFVVMDKLDLVVMISISLKAKHFPGLIFLWMIYLCILNYVYQNLTLGLRLRDFVFSLQNSSSILLYITTSLVITAIIFWIYKPHQNTITKYMILSIQQASAFLHIHKAQPEKPLIDVLFFQFMLIGYYDLILHFIRYVLYKFYSCLEDALKWAWNLFLSIIRKCVVNFMNITLYFIVIFLLEFLFTNSQALIICFNITKLTLMFGILFKICIDAAFTEV